MKIPDTRRPLLLAATAALALGALRPAFAASDDDFAAQLGPIQDLVYHDTGDQKKLFHRTTEESGPNDPLLLMQSPLLKMIRKVEPSVLFLSMAMPKDGEAAGADKDKKDDGTGDGSKKKDDDKKKHEKVEHALCTGFVADSSKYMTRKAIITTNSHCVEKLGVGAEIGIGLYAGEGVAPRMLKGKVLAFGNSEAAKDIAFVELNDASQTPEPLKLFSKLDLGEEVVAIGNPYGLTFSVTRGIVSALDRDNIEGTPMIELNQSDVAVNPGNSGGPLFNLWGSVVGINTMIVGRSGGFSGISLSFPADLIPEAMRQFERTGNLKIGALQIAFGASTDTNKVSILAVTQGGPADAHLMAGDQIVGIHDLSGDLRVDGMTVRAAMKAFSIHVKYMSPGEKTSVVVRRGDQELTIEVTLGEPAKVDKRPKWAPIPPKPKNMSYETI